MRKAQFSVYFIRNVLFYTAARGFDLEQMCRAARLDRAVLHQPDEMVDGAVVERVWAVAIELTGDEDLGLHLGEAVHPASLGLLGFAMLSCETLGAAIEKLARYWNLMSDATVVEWRREQTRAVLALRLVDLPGNFLVHSRHAAESSLSAALTIVQGLTGRRLDLLDVASIYPHPRRSGEFERIFGRMPRFEAEANQIAFSSEALDWPLLHANAGMLAGFEEQMQARLKVESPETLVGRVRQEIAKGLRGDLPDLAVVAKNLHMSSRALQRELQAVDTSFRQVLDELRHELALSYLGEQKYSIADVSFLLGFSEASVFHRSFRKWTGLTPVEFRRGLSVV
jgi:AraC-like DNA-binding protein